MIIEGTMRKGKAIRDNAGYDSKLNKTVALNSTNRLFMRLTPKVNEETGETEYMDLISAIVPGRSCNYDVCNTSFIKLDDKQMEYDPSSKKWKDISGLDAWARIAKVLHAAECANQKQIKEFEAKAVAEATKQPVDSTKLQSSLDIIDRKYFGGKDEAGKNVMPDVSPIISGLQFKTTTQVLVVPVSGEGDVPDFEKARTAYIELSNDRISELIGILDDRKYCGLDDEFLEIEYKFYGKDTKEAGRKAKFTGVTPEYRLSKLHPDLWASQGKKALDKMVKGSTVMETADLMAGRNIGLSGNKSVSDIEACVRKYCSTNPAVISCIAIDTDEVKLAAKDLVAKGLVDGIPDIKNSLQELIDQQNDAKEASATEESAEGTTEQEAQAVEDKMAETDNAVMEAVDATKGVGTLTELTQKVENVDALSGDEFDGDM